jgi:hypothetical protein
VDDVAKDAIRMHCTVGVRVHDLRRYADGNENCAEPSKQVALDEVSHPLITPVATHRYDCSLEVLGYNQQFSVVPVFSNGSNPHPKNAATAYQLER